MSTPHASEWHAGRCASRWMSEKKIEKQPAEHSRIRICLLRCNLSWSYSYKEYLPSPCAECGGWRRYLQLQIWPEGLRVGAWVVVFSRGSAHGLCGLVIWWHLLILHTSIPIWCFVQCFYFKALQWITLRNRVSDLLVLNLYSMSFRGTFFFFAFWGQNTTCRFRKAGFDPKWKPGITIV